MRAVIDAVRDAGISKLLFEVLPDNSAMIGLIRRNGGQIVERGPMLGLVIDLTESERSAA